jgi:hypothetical protein
MEVKLKMADKYIIKSFNENGEFVGFLIAFSAKYIIKSFKENGEFVGFLSSFSASGMNQFAPQSIQAILFDTEEECIYSEGQTWQEGRSDEKGYYKIEKVILKIN